MASITLAQAAAWCGGTVETKYADVCFDGASNDTRTIRAGQLFVALIGARNGNDYVDVAFEKGAVAVLTSEMRGDYPAILVDNPRIALGRIAAGLRRAREMKIVGVTGSVGKSTTKEMIASVLEGDYIVGKTPANFNNDLGLPMAILGMDDDTQVGVLEMGMSHFGEISYLSEIAGPDIGVITNIGTMHIENLGSREGILQAKMEILDGMADDALLCLYADDDLLWGSRENLPANVCYFGSRNGASDVRASDVHQNGGLSFAVHTEKEDFSVTLPVEGEHYVSDALAAISVGLSLGVAPERIIDRLSRFQNMAGRQEIFEAKGCTIIKDCYNAGPESMEAALKVLGRRKGRRIAVLGDMLELGAHTREAHERVGRLSAQYADVLLAYGPNSALAARSGNDAGLKDALVFDDRESMAKKLRALCLPGDVLLFKGSHGMHMELVLEKFLNEM